MQPGATQQPATGKARRSTVVATVVAVIAVYVGSLLGYALFGDSPRDYRFSEPTAANETVVILRLRQLETWENKLTVDVETHPGRELLNRAPNVADNMTGRLSFWTQSSELLFVHSDLTADDSVTIGAIGDPDDWPFDSYVTDFIGVETFTGTNSGQATPARIIVAGHITGWRIGSEFGTINSPPAPEQTVRLTFQRSRGSLMFDLGVCLVLLALPATALFVAIETWRGRRAFLPPLTTWFAAMLFAVVPLRTLLPDAPPVGAWIDQAIVLWVLVALVVAMVLYIAAWWEQFDGK